MPSSAISKQKADNGIPTAQHHECGRSAEQMNADVLLVESDLRFFLVSRSIIKFRQIKSKLNDLTRINYGPPYYSNSALEKVFIEETQQKDPMQKIIKERICFI